MSIQKLPMIKKLNEAIFFEEQQNSNIGRLVLSLS